MAHTGVNVTYIGTRASREYPQPGRWLPAAGNNDLDTAGIRGAIPRRRQAASLPMPDFSAEISARLLPGLARIVSQAADPAAADLAPLDLAPADLAPADLAPADLAPADLTAEQARSYHRPRQMTARAAIAHRGGDVRRTDPVSIWYQRPQAPRAAAGSRPDTGAPSVQPRPATSGEALPDDSFLIRSQTFPCGARRYRDHGRRGPGVQGRLLITRNGPR
jgi:hypothetical protein